MYWARAFTRKLKNNCPKLVEPTFRSELWLNILLAVPKAPAFDRWIQKPGLTKHLIQAFLLVQSKPIMIHEFQHSVKLRLNCISQIGSLIFCASFWVLLPEARQALHQANERGFDVLMIANNQRTNRKLWALLTQLRQKKQGDQIC